MLDPTVLKDLPTRTLAALLNDREQRIAIDQLSLDTATADRLAIKAEISERGTAINERVEAMAR